MTELAMSSAALAALDEDPWDLRDTAEDELDAAWEAVEAADWLEPSELNRLLHKLGRLAWKAARETALDPNFWRTVLREAREIRAKLEDSKPERLREKAEKKREHAARAKARGNAERAAKLLEKAAALETEAKASEARRGNGAKG